MQVVRVRRGASSSLAAALAAGGGARRRLVGSAARQRPRVYVSSTVAAAAFAGVATASAVACSPDEEHGDAAAVTAERIAAMLELSGIAVSDEELAAFVKSAKGNLRNYQAMREIDIPNDVSPPYHFSALMPGMAVDRVARPLVFSRPKQPIERPADLEALAFWPVKDIAELLRSRQITAVELTQMYLGRLHRYNPVLNCAVTILDDYALAEAQKADADIAAGNYKGMLHGIPWGAKDIISLKGYETTWGSNAFKDQVLDQDASVVEMLSAAGAICVAKLATGELAGGDKYFNNSIQCMNPWDTTMGSMGSSAGPASATAAGCVGFALGTETGGSILGPAGRCGTVALRPTFGRVSRHGVMALSWSQDRVGPFGRHAEDVACVMSAISGPDDRDMSVSELPFNWDTRAQGTDLKHLRVGIIPATVDEIEDPVAMENTLKALELLKVILGVDGFVEVEVPDIDLMPNSMGVESVAFFDKYWRDGTMKGVSKERYTRGQAGRIVPAVEHLQSQRLRTMLMAKLEAATRDVDLYIVANGNNGRNTGSAAGKGPASSSEVFGTVQQQHSKLANQACYPCVTVPSGFSATGSPTNFHIFGRPFKDSEALALAMAYQETAMFHSVTPTIPIPSDASKL